MKIFESVLFIGPDHRNHRGGIGAVLDVYSRNIRPFKFIPTYVTGSFTRILQVYLSAIFKLIRVCITDNKIRILHIHHASKGSFLRKSVLFFIGKMFGKKVILHIHGGGFHNFYRRSKILKPVIRYVLEHADVVICLSGHWKTYYSETFRIRRLEIINNVIEDPRPEAAGERNGTVNLLFLGHINENKGIFDLLKVIGLHKKSYSRKVTLTIGGIGNLEKMNRLINEYDLSEEVKFEGWVSGEKKSELLNRCDAYVLPSYNEGLPLSILEAMSYGKPVISTKVGGIPEIIKPGFNGWLFQPGNEEELNSIIAEAAGDRELMQVYGDRSLSLAQAYTAGSVVKELEKLYRSLLNEQE